MGKRAVDFDSEEYRRLLQHLSTFDGPIHAYEWEPWGILLEAVGYPVGAYDWENWLEAN